MMKIIALNKQTFFDISVIATGVSDNALFIAQYNSKNPSSEIEPGTEILIPESVVYEEGVKAYFDAYKIRPATGFSAAQKEILTGCEGIGCWVIGGDFVVGSSSGIGEMIIQTDFIVE